MNRETATSETKGRRLSLTEWAALAEVVASLAVVVSLLFLVFTIRQNTNAMHGAGENILFERHAELQNLVISDPSLAAIFVRMRAGEELSDVDAIRWEKYELNVLDIWALAHSRYRNGLLSDDAWTAWDTYFVSEFKGGTPTLTRERWQGHQSGFDRAFWEHVNASLF